MEADKEDFGGLTPANTPLDRVEIRRMEMSFFVVPARLKKLKRLVDNLYSANAESALHYSKGKNSVLK